MLSNSLDNLIHYCPRKNVKKECQNPPEVVGSLISLPLTPLVGNEADGDVGLVNHSDLGEQKL